MKWEEFVKIIGELPVIDSEDLLAGISVPDSLYVQLSRWKRAGKLTQVKKGIYLLAEPYRKVEVYEPYLASILKKPAYISLEKALEYHNLIPEAVPVYTCVTTKRPCKFISKAGSFTYRHIKSSLFWGYDSVTVHNQTAFIASPEKGLLDLFYLKEAEVSLAYLEELRLQNTEKIDIDRLFRYAEQFKKPKILCAAEKIKEYISVYKTGEEEL